MSDTCTSALLIAEEDKFDINEDFDSGNNSMGNNSNSSNSDDANSLNEQELRDLLGYLLGK